MLNDEQSKLFDKYLFCACTKTQEETDKALLELKDSMGEEAFNKFMKEGERQRAIQILKAKTS